ncbi:MAG: FtsX-like permease family protein [Pseudomonadota bacterium]
MRAIRFGLRSLWRDARAGELAVLLAALIVAAGTVTAIGFLTDRINQAVQRQASEVLAADVRLRSAQPLPPIVFATARGLDLRTARILNFPSVVFRDDESVLATIQAVSSDYPLRGEVRIAPSIGAPGERVESMPEPGVVWFDTALLARLGAAPGEQVEIGARTFTIGAVLSFRPDQNPGFSGLSATLIMNIDDVPSTQLVQEGSRVQHFGLMAGQPAQVERFIGDIQALDLEGVRLQSQGDAGNQLNNAIDRAGRFLGLASLISLLLAAVAVAMSARRYAQRRLDTAALMKTVGASQRFVLLSALSQLVVIGLIASFIGAALGYGAERLLTTILADLLQDDLPPASFKPFVLGIGTVLILLTGFALPAVMHLGDTPPARVLRKDLLPPPTSAWLTYGLAILALGGLVYWSVRDLPLLVVILGGTAVTGAVLFGVGRLLVALLSKRSNRVGVAWRYGLANIARRGSDSAVQIVAFGLGLMVLLVLTIVRNDLLLGWRATLDATASNQFIINIQPGEVDGLMSLMDTEGLGQPELVPLVRARMTHVDGVEVTQRVYADPRGRRLANRDANLTYGNQLPASNTVVAGEWWGTIDGDYLDERDDVSATPNAPHHRNGSATSSPDQNQVSVEIDAAQSMALPLGSVITINVAGNEIEATVTSHREVRWESFEPNFFMVFTPAALADAPQTFITSFNVEDDQRSALLKLVRAYPGISVIDIEATLDQVRRIIDKAVLAVQVVFLFTLLAGVVVLFAAVQSTLDERRYESALLRTFGAKRRTVFMGLAAEFTLLGLASGLFAALGATIVGALAATQLFNMPWSINPWLWLVGATAGAAIVGVSGIAATKSAIDTPPVTVLR